MSKDTIGFTWVDDNGDEHEEELPGAYDVCDRCEGKGSHVNPSIDGHGIGAEEWENDWDDESREMYFSGGYDVQCQKCNGLRVVLVVSERLCNPELLKKYREHQARARRITIASARWSGQWARRVD